MERKVRAQDIVAMFFTAAVVLVTLSFLSVDTAYGYTATVGISNPTSASNDFQAAFNQQEPASRFVVSQMVAFDEVTQDDSDTPVSTATPEPGTLILLGAGLVGMAKFIRRRV